MPEGTGRASVTMTSIPTATEKKPSVELKEASDTFTDPKINDPAPFPNLKQEMFVFSGTEGMARPLLSSDWAAALNTSDQEKERLLNETFNFSQTDKETKEMIEFTRPCFERTGLRSVMKVSNQKYPGRNGGQDNLNDTDSKKRQNLAVDEG